MEKKYSLEDVGMMSNLTTRTLRNYIKRGLLQGEKLEGVWRFDERQIEAFFKEPFVKQSIGVKKLGIILDYLVEQKREEIRVCSIYNIPVSSKKEAEIICDVLMKAINSGVYHQMQCNYSYEKDMVRIILKGRAIEMAALIEPFIK